MLPQKTVATRAGDATLVSARHSQKTGDIISSMWKLALILFFFISPLFAQEVQRPPEIIAQFNHAVELQQQNKLSAAANGYQKILQRAPDYLEAQANLGVVLARLGKNDSMKHYLLGRLYRELGRREDSKKEFNEARKLKAEEAKTDREKTTK